MPKIKIDGKEYEALEGETILQAAQRNGIYIPRYCYHPALSVAGNCRMCLVEIEKMPKLQISCSTAAQDGMVILTQSEKVKKARQDILEFLLINHPVDCPICDQAGECYLQDYYMDYGLHKSRFKMSDKIRREKRIQIGDYLTLDRERCILCTRCVRFCEEVTKTNELFVAQRGDHSFIDIKPGEKLNNPYSLNIADICPVGAFTSSDFRFRKRVWFLKTEESVCLGCATGCRIKVQYDENTVYRIMTSPNEHTNTWLCDAGRMTYKELYAEKRLRKIKIDGQEQQGKGLSAVYDKVSQKNPEKTAVILSPYLSVEDNMALYLFARHALKSCRIFLPQLKDRKISDGILRNCEPAANAAAMEIFAKVFSIEIFNPEKAGEFDFVITCKKTADRLHLEKEGLYFSLEDCGLEGILIPIKSYFETKGTFINWKNRAAVTSPAVKNENKFEVWRVLSELASLYGSNLPFENLSELEEICKKEILDGHTH